MTATEIAAMPAGPELDALVAEKVVGYEWAGKPRGIQYLQPKGGGKAVARRHHKEVTYFGYQTPLLPGFSTDIAAAWLVLEWLRNRWGQISLVAGLEWHCYPCDKTKGREWGTGDTPMLAICRAALLEFFRTQPLSS